MLSKQEIIGYIWHQFHCLPPMSLIHEFERSGNLLFRYREQIPLIFFALATPVILWGDHSWISPRREIFLAILAIVISLLGIILRAWTIGTTPAGTSGRNTREQVAEALNTTGIYSMVRHPLYLGNFLMWAGLLVFTGHPWFILVVCLAYWIYYERIMFAEERFLSRKYGEQYESWSLQAPSFLPSFRRYRRTDIPFSLRSVFRREYSGWLATAIGFAYIDILRTYALGGGWEWQRVSVFVLAAFSFLAILLRSLKHHTRILHEAGRS